MKLPQEFSSATSDRKMKQASCTRRPNNCFPPKSKRRNFERKKPHDDYSEWRRELL